MMFSRFSCAALAMLAFSSLVSNAATIDSTVRVEIDGLRNAKGDVGCLLFNSPDGFPESHSKAYNKMHAPVDGGNSVCEFTDVKPGTYAVVAFHDENQNEKLDKNFLGIPIEGYAASNNIRHAMSAPEFGESSFVVLAGGLMTIKISVKY